MVPDELAPRDDGAAVPAPDGTADAQDAEAQETEASAEVMKLLSQHVPLTLLADLAAPAGPESPQILEDEGLPPVAWWESGDQEETDSGTPDDATASHDAQVSP